MKQNYTSNMDSTMKYQHWVKNNSQNEWKPQVDAN